MPVLHKSGTAVLRLACIIALMALAGCTVPTQPLLAPLAPRTLGESVTVRQQVTAHFDDNVRRMQVALSVTPNDLSLIGLTAIGQRLFTLSWRNGQAHMHSHIKTLSQLEPARILADLQLAYWPLPALRRALPDDLQLAQYGTARVLWRDGRLLWFASSDSRKRWHSTMTIYNARMGYRLTIKPLTFSQQR